MNEPAKTLTCYKLDQKISQINKQLIKDLFILPGFFIFES